MALHIFDPTHELKAAGIRPAPRPLTLEGKTVGSDVLDVLFGS